MKGFLNKKIVAILALLLAGVFFLIYWSYGRIDDKFVITVDGYTLGKSKGITVGRDSDIFFDKVSKAYMTLDFTDDQMTLKVDKSADTLMYYKVNGDNPNLFEIKTDIRVKKYGKEIVISPKTVKEIFSRYSSPGLIDWVTGDRPTQYIMLRHIIALAPDVEEATKKTATSDDMLRSFIYSDGKKFSLCILDKEVQLGDDKYVYSYSFPPVEGIYNLQFFKMAVNSFRKSEPGKTDVTVDSVCYAAKPVLLTTMWGAGHVAFKTNSEKGKLSVDVSFPKGITYVDDLDRLVKCAKRTSDMMTVSQKGNSFPVFNNIYLTAFSNGAVQDFATIDFDRNGRNIRLVDSCNDTTSLRRSGFFYPLQQKVSLKSDTDTVRVRTAVLDKWYWRSYLFFPTVIYFLMLLLGFMAFRTGRATSNYVNANRLDDFRGYFSMLLTVMYAYILCKIFIAIKLSFTYPYFEKISGVIVTSTGLMLLLMSSISFLMNIKLAEHKLGYRPRSFTFFDKVKDFIAEKRQITSFLILLLGYAICILSMYLMDKGNSLEMRNSYFNSNITFFTSPLSWPKHAGINDTHRSVCYTLFLIEAVVLFLISLKVFKGVYLTPLRMLKRIFPAIAQKVENAYMWFKGMIEKWDDNFITNFIIAFVLLLIAMAVPGNYATAIITLTVVLTLSRMVITYDELKKENIWQNLGRLPMYFLVFIMAVLPDQGYIVSWLGMAVAIMMFPIMSCRVDYYNASSKSKMGNTVSMYFIFGALLVVGLLGMKSAISLAVNPENVSWGRMERRLNMFSNYDQTREAGFRYSEADMEFMQIMCHYMQDYSMSEEPLSAEFNPLHKSISTGQSPVVLNDVSAQAAFFAPIGLPAHVIFLLLLVVLAGIVMVFCLAREYTDEDSPYAFRITRQRMLAMLIWLGASTYLYLSYLGNFPYTGRLLHGFGVDSVGEALEICLLMAFMSHVAIAPKKKNS